MNKIAVDQASYFSQHFKSNFKNICLGNIISGVTWLKLVNLKLEESRDIVEYWDEHHRCDISPSWPSEQRENQ